MTSVSSKRRLTEKEHEAVERTTQTEELLLHAVDGGIEVYDGDGTFLGSITNDGIRNHADRPTDDVHVNHYVEYHGALWNCQNESERRPIEVLEEDPREAGECPFCGDSI